ncbi:hypothetical protein L3i22_071360 [Actinoplanes sp. L3-i22]|nr:hypothetical protein L3i22_071360 [Actinoplanes sp. L3-i22]
MSGLTRHSPIASGPVFAFSGKYRLPSSPYATSPATRTGPTEYRIHLGTLTRHSPVGPTIRKAVIIDRYDR